MSLLWNKIFMNFIFLCLSYVQEGAEIFKCSVYPEQVIGLSQLK